MLHPRLPQERRIVLEALRRQVGAIDGTLMAAGEGVGALLPDTDTDTAVPMPAACACIACSGTACTGSRLPTRTGLRRPGSRWPCFRPFGGGPCSGSSPPWSSGSGDVRSGPG